MQTFYEIHDKANIGIGQHKQIFDDFFPYMKQHLGYDKPVSVYFLSDPKNSEKALGKTGHYNPAKYSISVYADGRHIKDVLRSVAHELVHHTQNCRGEFEGEMDASPGYALKDGPLWDMEKEAYSLGNQCFRRWEDTYKMKHDLFEWKKKELMFLLIEKFTGTSDKMREIL